MPYVGFEVVSGRRNRGELQTKKERCAKVTGEVVYQVVSHLNEYFDGKWTPPKWSPKEEIAHCWKCHGSDDMWHDKVSLNNQQGHMDCLLCHKDHTKKKKQTKK